MKSKSVNLSNEKLKGRFYTPPFIVDDILDLVGYHGVAVSRRHIIDNSCGDGAFLTVVAERYCRQFFETNDDKARLSAELAEYIHGIEIDKAECDKCVKNLDAVAKKYGLNNIAWDIRCGDALQISDYNGKMDFVVGNPPYVRVHNLGDSFDEIKRYSFAQNGMTDLFIVFYEIGINMLGKNGVLGYITPSSFFNSVAGKYMRDFLVENNLIDKIVDLKHFQAFSATTYTTIVVLKKNRDGENIEYFQFDEKNGFPYYVDTLNAKDYFMPNGFYFDRKEVLSELRKILSFRSKTGRFSVKNGFATLADGVFIGDFFFDDYVIPVIKASTGKWTKCLFPYRDGKLISYDELSAKPLVKQYLESNKSVLINRSIEKSGEWYGFGRTQGIKDVYINKYAINTLIRSADDIKLVKSGKGKGVYSGLYIVTDVSEGTLRDILFNDDFVRYVAALGKYKSGGYYTFSSKELGLYLEYKFWQRYGKGNI